MHKYRLSTHSCHGEQVTLPPDIYHLPWWAAEVQPRKKGGRSPAIFLCGFLDKMSWSWKIEFLEIQNFNKLGVTWLGDPIVRGRLVERKRLMCGSTSKQLSWACTQFLSKSLLTWTCTYPIYIRRRVRVPGQGRPWRLSIKAPLLWHSRKSANQRSTRIRLNLLKKHLIFEGFWGTHFFM